MRASVCRWPRPGVRTFNFYAPYSTGKHEPALCLWNAKNGEKNPDNVPERRAHRVTHSAAGWGRRRRASGSNGHRSLWCYSPTARSRQPTTPRRLCSPRGSVVAARSADDAAAAAGISVAGVWHTARTTGRRRQRRRLLPPTGPPSISRNAVAELIDNKYYHLLQYY